MINFLKGFYTKYPEYNNRELYVAGHSYGGHTVPLIGDAIFKDSALGKHLAGIAIGNGWFDSYI